MLLRKASGINSALLSLKDLCDAVRMYEWDLYIEVENNMNLCTGHKYMNTRERRGFAAVLSGNVLYRGVGRVLGVLGVPLCAIWVMVALHPLRLQGKGLQEEVVAGREVSSSYGPESETPSCTCFNLPLKAPGTSMPLRPSVCVL
jgi:hypothetical protein